MTTAALSGEVNTWLLARAAGAVVGVAEVQLPSQDNTHMGTLEINVVPSARRRGVGRALHAEAIRRARATGRSHLYGEVLAPDETGSAATAFARSMGGRPAHTEHHLVLTLPASEGVLSSCGEPDRAYETMTWEGACPDDYRSAYIAMRNRMMEDVPVGEIAFEPTVFDDARLRHLEERWAQTFRVLTTAVRERATGDFAGYSLMLLPRDSEREVWQEDTLVMPDHRGHRLGLALKQANLERLTTDHPSRQRVHTWTAPDNTAMHRINERFGFRAVELMHEMEFRLD